MLGIYADNKLIKSIVSEERASEFIPKILQELLGEFEFERLIYANGPGSFMGIKISYVSLRTLSIVKQIPLFAVLAFELNDYKPIQANKSLCFIWQDGEIKLGKQNPGEFKLPLNLQNLKLKNDNLPFYFLDAI